MLKIWPQVKVMTWSEKFMLHISRSVSSAWTHLWCFHRSSLSLSNVIAKKLLVTFHDLKDIGDMMMGHWLQLAICCFGVSILPASRCWRVIRMVFVQSRRLSIVSHWWRSTWMNNIVSIKCFIIILCSSLFNSSKSYKMNIFRTQSFFGSEISSNKMTFFIWTYFWPEEGLCPKYMHFVRFGTFKKTWT